MLEIGPCSPHKLILDEAWLYCITLEHNGHRDWRLPTWHEMNSHQMRNYSGWTNPYRPTLRFQMLVYPVRDI
jgi:hypothetical protein